MNHIDHLIKGEKLFDETYSLGKILGSPVLSKSGILIGHVKQARILPETLTIEGILVKRKLFKKSVYIGKSFFSHINQDAIILNMDPTFLLKGARVLSLEGEHLGKISKVIRKGNSNNIDKLIISSSFIRKKSIVESNFINKIGESVFLSEDYHVDKKYLWQKS